MTLLSDEDLEAALTERREWTHVGDAITRKFELQDFVTAIAFVNDIAVVAEERNHHPDLLVSDYKMVTATITTHSAGGLTISDFGLAGAIDKLATAYV
jgi:4a-hydroxytetrahydrobiopterin dehydratase